MGSRIMGVGICTLSSFLGISAAASAEVDLLTLVAGPGDSWFGASVSSIGDVDGDGVPDVLVGVMRADVPFVDCGAARVYSGRDGSLLAVVTGLKAGDQLGGDVAAAGDVDADGFTDIVAGSLSIKVGPFNSHGGIRVYSVAKHAVLFDAYGDSPNDWLGMRVAGLGDVNADGFDDVAASAPYDDGTGADTGSVRGYAGPVGAVLWTTHGSQSNVGFARAFAALGDANGDGIGDVAIGVPGASIGGTSTGQLRLHSGATGAFLTGWAGAPFESLGYSVASAGDLDGDSRADAIVGTTKNVVRILSGATGATLKSFAGGAAGDGFGSETAMAGDFDGDSTPDVVVGALFSDLNGDESGAAYVFSGATQAILQTYRGAGAHQDFGTSVAGIGDVDFDGRGDVAIGAPDHPLQNGDSGAVSIYVGLPSTCANVPSSVDFNVDGVPDACQTCQSNIAAGGPGNMKQHVCGDPLTIAGSNAILGISQGTPNGLCVLLASTFHSPNPAFGGTIWPIPVQVMLTFTLDAEGSFRLPLQGGPNGPIHVYLQSIAPWVGGPKPYEISPATHLVLGY